MLRALISSLIDALVPPRGSERLVRTLTLAQVQNLRTGDGLPYHDPRVRSLVWELKYYANPRAAALCAAVLEEDVLAAAGECIGIPLLVPVPMHQERRRERGHNQTEVLCEALVRRIQGIEYAPHALVRSVHTPTQQGLPKQVRIKNVSHSMHALASVAGRACIVVDDVSTTGATLAECKRALKGAGARAVHTVVLAHS
ncbi:MAG: ComF family protein [Patescibacteria group bacterium]|nr:ComF family protein [Patescibacteria group bacterium]